MGQTNVVEYVGKSLGERGGELLKVLNLLMDRGVIEFHEGDSAGYLDSLGLADGKTLEDVDAVLAEYLEPQAGPTGNTKVQTLRGKYDGYDVSHDNLTRQLFGIDPDGKFRRIERNTQAVVKVVSAELTGEREDKAVKVLLQNVSKVREVMQGLSAQDKLVFFAICDLVEKHQYIVTPLQLYRKIAMKPNANPREAQLDEMHASIVRMADIYITLDVDAILDAYPGVGAIKDSGSLIEIVRWSYKSDEDGNIHRLYEFGRTLPVLFQYATALNQMTTLQPHKIGVLSFGIRRTAFNATIVDVIGDRVTMLDGMAKQGKRIPPNMHRIAFKTLYDKADYSKDETPNATRMRKTRIRNAVVKQVEYLECHGIISRHDMDEDGVSIFVPGEGK